MSTPTLLAQVRAMRWEAEGILSVELRPGSPTVMFPPFDAGSHIDLHLANGLSRSYSLCNPPGDDQRYVVGVALDRNTRGGSRFVHQQLRVGQTLAISPPRNNFRLHEDAPRSLLVSGGIGITPIWAMLQRLAALGRPAELVYCARSRQEAAFIEPISALVGPQLSVAWHFDDEQAGPPDLGALLQGRPADGHFYCCGPGPMLDAFVATCQRLGYANAHIERFSAAPVVDTGPAQGFVVRLHKTGREVVVPPDQSILDALIDAGLDPDHSCKEGVCGACETAVLEGSPDHHDGILTQQEREAGKTMMICVSRCKGARLVLDL